MSGIQLSGLASGFDWKSFVDQVMDLERVSVVRLENEQVRNIRQIDALSTLKGKISSFRTAVDALKDPALFAARSATASDDSWQVRADSGTTLGDYSFNVTRLASASRLTGAADRGAGIAGTSDVSSVLVADLPGRIPLTEGFFTVNGAQVTVSYTDSLQDVFDRISTATGGAVSASYDPASDSVSLSSATEIVLGAANDTANFTYALGLFNNGTNAISGQEGLGTIDLYSKIADARLRDAVTAVDGAGAGSFTINGTTIDYNVTADSINDVIARINASGAGVRATFDSTSDRLVLTNARTGDSGIHVSEAAGGLLEALGLSSGATLQRGTDAQFTLNNGSVLTSPTNVLDASAHGVAGLSLTAHATGSTTVTVTNDTDGVGEAIDTFISRYNDIQDYIEQQTRITTSGESVSTATLSGNREVSAWAREMRSLAFSALDGATGTVTRLESLGIDFVSGSNKLEIKEPGKLSDAIAQQTEDVQTFFSTATTGFAARMEGFVDRLVGLSDSGGYLKQQTSQLERANSSLDDQIDRMERHLEQRRSLMEASFIAMEEAQQRITAMQQQLVRAFPTTNNNAKS